MAADRDAQETRQGDQEQTELQLPGASAGAPAARTARRWGQLWLSCPVLGRGPCSL